MAPRTSINGLQNCCLCHDLGAGVGGEGPLQLLLPRQHSPVCSEPTKCLPGSPVLDTHGFRGWTFRLLHWLVPESPQRHLSANSRSSEMWPPFHDPDISFSHSPWVLCLVKAWLHSEAELQRSLTEPLACIKLCCKEWEWSRGNQSTVATRGWKAVKENDWVVKIKIGLNICFYLEKEE